MAVLRDGKKSITISVESEQEAIQNTVAQHPVNRGDPIVDHTQRESYVWDFDGKIYGKDQKAVDSQYTQLMNWQRNGTLLQYIGAVRGANMLITDLHKTYDDGGFSNAVKFSMSLTNVTIVTTSFVKAVNVGVKAPAKPKAKPKNPGTYITVRAGNTYWGWYMKYGTSINQLRAWNKWPDRRIPIGARARVK